MSERVDLYSSYADYTHAVLDAVRKETFGADIGQNSWTTADELARLLPWLRLADNTHALEIACGSGGLAVFMARTIGCRVTGTDVSESAVATAASASAASGCAERLRFLTADGNAALPFDDMSFDAVVCIDSMNHLPDRLGVLREWRRVLRPGGRALFTDPVVITGPVTNDELALRSSIGTFLFVPPGVNEELASRAGLGVVHREDVTDNMASIAGRWRAARASRADDLVRLEGQERFDGLQRFFDAVHRLSGERRLSRTAYVLEKHAA
ncbi:MAG TPA: class I SAM-dependent methyltransferase [Phycisphaerales bacterium]|nr:class I SAM-dependent methyltransferase [Phycisphaerales bacterium]